MPTVLRHGPYRFYFYSHEPREPAHVHIDRDNSSAKIWLDPVSIASYGGFRPPELRRLMRLVKVHHKLLSEAWHEHKRA